MTEGSRGEGSQKEEIMAFEHISVLLYETVDGLNVKPDGIYVDATLGGGGHAYEVCSRLGSQGRLIGIDQDADAIRAAGKRLECFGEKVTIVRSNYCDMKQQLQKLGIDKVDGITVDLGVSSYQLDTAERGFSYRVDAPLDMRMDPGKNTLTAAEVVNTYNAADLTRIIRSYSDERWASRIADFIVRAREKAPLETSAQLVDVIKAAIPASARRAGGHPAKRTFQALRIEVNGELDVLKSGLEAAIRWANPGGRICVISYHSLEDRIVKDMFQSFANRCTCPPDLPVCMCGKEPILKVLTRKPIVPTADEIARNPRARSAKLRVAQKL